MAVENTEMRTSILNILSTDKEDALSRTAVAKQIGYAKGSKVVDRILDELVQEKKAKVTDSGKGYDVYYKTVSGEKESATIAKNSGDESAETKSKDSVNYRIPTNTYGFKVQTDVEVKIDGKKRMGVIVTTPDNKTVELKKTERLLVINLDDDHRYIVDKPEDVFRAIGEYTSEKNIGNFLVTDMESNKPVNPNNVKDLDVQVLFLKISKHNKAGVWVKYLKSIH